MTTVSDKNGDKPTGCDVEAIINEIARDINLKDYKIVLKNVDFSGDNFLGEIARVKILSNDENGRKPLNLIVKKAPLALAAREILPVNSYYKYETYAYSKLLPSLYKLQEENKIPNDERFTFAKFYKGITEEFKEVIVLKDLSVDGFIMHNKRKPFDVNHAVLAVKNIARLHATSFVMREKNPKLFEELVDNIAHKMNFTDAMIHMIMGFIDKTSATRECPIERKRLEELKEKATEKFYEHLDAGLTEPYNVICHGDCWNNNMLFKYENEEVKEVIFVDWQLIRLASPITDLSYMMCVSLDKQFLEIHLRELLDIYYDTLEKTVSSMGCRAEKCYPRAVFNKHFKKIFSFGFYLSFCVIPFTLSDPGKAKDVEEAVKDMKEKESKNIDVAVSNLAKERLDGVISYFLNEQLI